MNEILKITYGDREIAVDTKKKMICEGGNGEEKKYEYDKLVITVGDDEKKKSASTSFVKSLKAVGVALLVSLVISAVWYMAEYIQFGELQWNRECDNIVSMLYMIALTIGFSKWFD